MSSSVNVRGSALPDLTPEADRAWYRLNGCSHAHCPYGCQHPQPFMHNGALVCGRCWFKDGERTLMDPCTLEVCDG